MLPLKEHLIKATAFILQINLWIVGDSREDVIRREHEIRSNIYKQKQEDAVYPDYWNV